MVKMVVLGGWFVGLLRFVEVGWLVIPCNVLQCGDDVMRKSAVVQCDGVI